MEGNPEGKKRGRKPGSKTTKSLPVIQNAYDDKQVMADMYAPMKQEQLTNQKSFPANFLLPNGYGAHGPAGMQGPLNTHNTYNSNAPQTTSSDLPHSQTTAQTISSSSNGLHSSAIPNTSSLSNQISDILKGNNPQTDNPTYTSHCTSTYNQDLTTQNQLIPKVECETNSKPNLQQIPRLAGPFPPNITTLPTHPFSGGTTLSNISPLKNP